VTQARHWNEEKKRAYRVADNQLESWREEFRNLKFGEFDLGLSRLLQGPHGSAYSKIRITPKGGKKRSGRRRWWFRSGAVR
jgi:hypothetical protein